jgi:hypothetical protein
MFRFLTTILLLGWLGSGAPGVAAVKIEGDGRKEPAAEMEPDGPGRTLENVLDEIPGISDRRKNDLLLFLEAMQDANDDIKWTIVNALGTGDPSPLEDLYGQYNPDGGLSGL